MGTPFESLMDVGMDGEEENEDEVGTGDDEGLGALITADYQLRQTRLRDEKDQDDFYGFHDEDEFDKENDDQTDDTL